MNKDAYRDDFVPTGSDRHPDMYKTVDLLKLDLKDGPLFLIVHGVSTIDDVDQMNYHQRYFYEEHTCPMNILGNRREYIQMIAVRDTNYKSGLDTDPHGLFTYVRSVWMRKEWVELDENAWEDKMLEIFPEMKGS